MKCFELFLPVTSELSSIVFHNNFDWNIFDKMFFKIFLIIFYFFKVAHSEVDVGEVFKLTSSYFEAKYIHAINFISCFSTGLIQKKSLSIFSENIIVYLFQRKI